MRCGLVTSRIHSDNGNISVSHSTLWSNNDFFEEVGLSWTKITTILSTQPTHPVEFVVVVSTILSAFAGYILHL